LRPGALKLIVARAITIRRATLADAELLSSLGARTFFETFADSNTEADMQQYLADSFNPAKQTAELKQPFTTFLLAEDGTDAAGYAMLQIGPPPNGVTLDRPIELVRLYVLREWHSKGVGAMLMQACIDEARKQDCGTVWLGVWEQNERARAFYQKWRFEEFGTHVFQLGSDPQNDFLMKLPLGET
jgi:ribosomal protein S18 acetylase RimI-like enzyme